MNPQEAKIQSILSSYLATRQPASEFASHPDHDTLAAFTEGRLNESQSMPMVSHLVDCSFCRHITAELIRLEAAFSEEPVTASVADTSQPGKVSEVLSGLFAKIFGTTENAVFAHNEDEKESEKDDETDETKPKE